MSDLGERPPEYERSTQPCEFENCGTRLFYIADGLKFCKRGHRQFGFQQTQEDEVGTYQIGSQTTRKKKEKRENPKKALHGLAGLRLYLSCYQLLLRHQCQVLIKKGFPEELEPIVQDLWCVRLPLIQEKYVESQPGVMDGDETGDSRPKMYSSQAEDTPLRDAEDDEVAPAGGRRKEGIHPTLTDSLSLCYMGIMLLKIPISLGDMFGWAIREEIPFLQPTRLFPTEMYSRLNTSWLNALENRYPLVPSRLHQSLSELTAFYHRHFDMQLPDLNYPPILYRYIKDLALPIDVFPTTKNLLSLLPDPLSFSAPTAKQRANHRLPETTLLSLLLIAVKLYHPFPPTPTVYSTSLETPGILTLNWSAWSAAHASHDAKEKALLARPFYPGDELKVKEEHALIMSDDQADAYMDWFEKTWIDERPKPPTAQFVRTVPESIKNMFSTGRHPLHELRDGEGPLPPDELDVKLREIGDALLKEVQGSLEVREIKSEKEAEGKVPRLGAQYRVYKKEEDLQGVALEFYQRLAQKAGMDVKDLIQPVLKIERELALKVKGPPKPRGRPKGTGKKEPVTKAPPKQRRRPRGAKAEPKPKLKPKEGESGMGEVAEGEGEEMRSDVDEDAMEEDLIANTQ